MNYWKLLALLPGLFTLPAAAIDGGEPDLLQPDQAFRFTASADDAASLQVTWDIADGYYMYRDRIRFNTATPGIQLGTPKLPAGQMRNDEFFGKIPVYRDRAVITIPVTRTPYRHRDTLPQRNKTLCFQCLTVLKASGALMPADEAKINSDRE